MSDVELVDAEPVDGDEPVMDAPEPQRVLTPAQRRIQKLAGVIQEDVSRSVLAGEAVEQLRQRLEWQGKRRPASPTIWKRAAVLALSATGMTHKEIGAVVGLEKSSVSSVLYGMRKVGIGVDTDARLDHDIVPRAVEQLGMAVDAGEEWAVMGALKGRGALRQHVASDGGGRGPMTVLAVKFEMPPGAPPALVGTVVGKPREDT